jgi:hypothetical protein
MSDKPAAKRVWLWRATTLTGFAERLRLNFMPIKPFAKMMVGKMMVGKNPLAGSRHTAFAVARRLVFERLGDRIPLDANGFEISGWPEGESGVMVPDFELTDVNPNSSTSNQGLSPRDYLQVVTGWYFTHST